jgi:hypothetical protein
MRPLSVRQQQVLPPAFLQDDALGHYFADNRSVPDTIAFPVFVAADKDDSAMSFRVVDMEIQVQGRSG